MAESQIKSTNSQSTVVKSMQAGTMDLAYKIKPHTSSGFSMPNVITPSVPNTGIFGNYTYFEVNNYNFLSKMDVDITCTSTVATGDSTINSTWHPSQIVDRVEFRTPQGLIHTVYGEAMKAYYDFAGEAVKNNSYTKFINPTTEVIVSRVLPTAAPITIKMKLEIPSPWTIMGSLTESLKFDLSKYTDFSVYIYFKTQVEANIPT